MEIISHAQGGVQSMSVVREGEKFVLLELSLELNTPYTVRSEPLQLVYAEALLAGSGTLSRAAFLDALHTLGAHIGVSAGGDSIDIVMRTRTENLQKTLTLLKTIFSAPRFEEKELKRIKELLINNLQLAKEDARARAQANFVNVLVSKDDYRYSYDIDEIIAQIRTITKKDLLKFHAQLSQIPAHYVVGGNREDCARTERVVLSILKQNTKAAPVTNEPHPLEHAGRTVKLFDIAHKQNIEFAIGAPLPLLRSDSDYAACSFGMNVLALQGGFSGRLMSIVREKEGLTYSIYGRIESVTKHQYGYWKIGTFFSPKDAIQGITSTLRELTRIHEQGITEDELVRFKAILNTRFTLVEDSLIRKVGEAFMLMGVTMTPQEFEAYKKQVASLTVENVNTALRKYFNPKELVISGAGPIASVKAELLAFGN